MASHFGKLTLISANPKGLWINMWAYVKVFGVPQWLIFMSLIISFIILNAMFIDLSKVSMQESPISSVFNATSIAFLLMIQLGDLSNVKGLGARILMFTTSMLTLWMFLCYSTDIIAEMTSGPPNIPVKNFEDVIQNGYTVFARYSVDTSIFLLVHQLARQ